MDWNEMIDKVEEEARLIRQIAETKTDPPGYLLGECKAHAVSILSLCERAREPRLKVVPLSAAKIHVDEAEPVA